MRTTFVACVLFCLAGCGGPGGTTITGTVKFDDGAPLSQGVVVLSSETKTFRGAVTPEGNYSVAAVLPGEYRVAITGTSVGGSDEGDSMEYNDETQSYVTPQGESKPPTELISKKFASSEDSGLSITVPSDDYSLTVTSP